MRLRPISNGMNFKQLKLELFYLIRALRYKVGRTYFYHKYLVAPKILQSKKVFEKPITNDNLSIHLLTCHRDLVMLIWSLASFYHHSKIIGQLFIHNDDSLTDGDKEIIKKFFPSCWIVDADQVLKSQLDNYPRLKKFRIEQKRFVLLKKFIDPYFISNKSCRLIIDSDLLWFNNPIEIKDQIDKGCIQSLMMMADTNCPVYFKDGRQSTEDLARLNSGIVLYQQNNFDLAKLESYLEALDLTNNENRHFIEQAGYSYCLKNLQALPMERYIVKGRVESQTVMRHYTSPRRVWFYAEGLKILNHRGYV